MNEKFALCLNNEGMEKEMTIGNVYRVWGLPGSDFVTVDLKTGRPQLKKARFAAQLPKIYIAVSDEDEAKAAKDILAKRGFPIVDEDYHSGIHGVYTYTDGLVGYTTLPIGQLLGYETFSIKTELVYNLEEVPLFNIPTKQAKMTKEQVLQYIEQLKDIVK